MPARHCYRFRIVFALMYVNVSLKGGVVPTPRADAVAFMEPAGAARYGMEREDNRNVCTGADRQRRRVLIADDHEIVVDMLRDLLQPEFDVAATVNDGLDLVEQAAHVRPDLVIIDISMPRLSGIEAARRIRELRLPARLVFLTMQTDPEVAAEAFAAGASGYMLKSESATEFLQALRHVAAGGRYLAPAILGGDIAALPARPQEDPWAHISLREREVLRLVVSGLPMKAVARRLGITPRTVAFHKYKAMEMLGLKDNAQLLEFALRHGLLANDVGPWPGCNPH